MTMYFVRKVQVFPILDQIKEDKSTIMDPRYPAIAKEYTRYEVI